MQGVAPDINALMLARRRKLLSTTTRKPLQAKLIWPESIDSSGLLKGEPKMLDGKGLIFLQSVGPIIESEKADTPSGDDLKTIGAGL